MKRRQFIVSSLVAGLAGVAGAAARGADWVEERFAVRRSNYWDGDSFHQDSVDMSQIDIGRVLARIEGRWEPYQLRELPKAFMDWNSERRLANLNKMRSGEMPDFAGPHNAGVATFGRHRGDSRLHLNNAIKGTGLCPKADVVDSLIARAKETQDAPMEEKFAVLESMYKDESLWDRTKLVSLELYSKPEFETHTFLNQMENPAASIVYLDIPSYEVRTIARLMHPKDSSLSAYEKSIMTYVNAMHTYNHTEFTAVVSACLYNVIEVFDNTPTGLASNEKKGVRIV